jgi:hypothetical protein
MQTKREGGRWIVLSVGIVGLLASTVLAKEPPRPVSGSLRSAESIEDVEIASLDEIEAMCGCNANALLLPDLCDDVESLEVTCDLDRALLQAKVISDLPPCSPIRLVADDAFYRDTRVWWWGRAWAWWRNPMPGEHEVCIEGCDICATTMCGCATDADCDDGLFCNGEETCDTDTGECVAGAPACAECDTCDEENDECSFGEGLLAYYPFDGDAGDKTGNGNNGTEYGGYYYVEGVCGEAVRFDGATGYVDLQEGTNLDGFDAFTIALWIKPATDLNSDTGRQDFVYKGPPVQHVTSYALMYDDTDGALAFHLHSQSYWFDASYITYEAEFPADEWFHVAARYDGVSSMQMYVNCEEVGAVFEEGQGVTGPIVDNAYPLTVAKRPDNQFYFNGTIDELRIYDRVLPVDEIQDLCQPNRQ